MPLDSIFTNAEAQRVRDVEPTFSNRPVGVDLPTKLQDIADAVDTNETDVAVNAAAITAGDLFQAAALADPGDGVAIPVTRSATVAITTAGVETNTLAIPTFLGQRMIFCIDVDGGSRAITAASAINIAGNTVMTLAEARDCIELVAIQLAGALTWEVAWNNAVALT